MSMARWIFLTTTLNALSSVADDAREACVRTAGDDITPDDRPVALQVEDGCVLSLLQTGVHSLAVDAEIENLSTEAHSQFRLAPAMLHGSGKDPRKDRSLISGALENVLAISTKYGEMLRTRSSDGLLAQASVLIGVIMIGCCITALLAYLSSDGDGGSRYNSSKGSQQGNQRLLRQRNVPGPGGAPASSLPGSMPQSRGSAQQSPVVQNLHPGQQSNMPPPGSAPPQSLQANRSPIPSQAAPPPRQALVLPMPMPGSPQLTQVTGGELSLPPPLCPALVLPHCEAWFAVAFDKLLQGVGTFDLLGLSGKALLRATVDSRSIVISMTPARSPALATVQVTDSGAMAVIGAGGRPYGEYRPGAQPYSYTLAHEGGPAASLVVESATNQMMMYMPGNAQPIAWAARCNESDFFSGVEHLEVRVSPRLDAVLVLCCVLASLIFGGVKLPVTARAAGASTLASLSPPPMHVLPGF